MRRYVLCTLLFVSSIVHGGESPNKSRTSSLQPSQERSNILFIPKNEEDFIATVYPALAAQEMPSPLARYLEKSVVKRALLALPALSTAQISLQKKRSSMRLPLPFFSVPLLENQKIAPPSSAPQEELPTATFATAYEIKYNQPDLPTSLREECVLALNNLRSPPFLKRRCIYVAPVFNHAKITSIHLPAYTKIQAAPLPSEQARSPYKSHAPQALDSSKKYNHALFYVLVEELRNPHKSFTITPTAPNSPSLSLIMIDFSLPSYIDLYANACHNICAAPFLSNDAAPSLTMIATTSPLNESPLPFPRYPNKNRCYPESSSPFTLSLSIPTYAPSDYTLSLPFFTSYTPLSHTYYTPASDLHYYTLSPLCTLTIPSCDLVQVSLIPLPQLPPRPPSAFAEIILVQVNLCPIEASLTTLPPLNLPLNSSITESVTELNCLNNNEMGNPPIYSYTQFDRALLFPLCNSALTPFSEATQRLDIAPYGPFTELYTNILPYSAIAITLPIILDDCSNHTSFDYCACVTYSFDPNISLAILPSITPLSSFTFLLARLAPPACLSKSFALIERSTSAMLESALNPHIAEAECSAIKNPYSIAVNLPVPLPEITTIKSCTYGEAFLSCFTITPPSTSLILCAYTPSMPIILTSSYSIQPFASPSYTLPKKSITLEKNALYCFLAPMDRVDIIELIALPPLMEGLSWKCTAQFTTHEGELEAPFLIELPKKASLPHALHLTITSFAWALTTPPPLFMAREPYPQNSVLAVPPKQVLLPPIRLARPMLQAEVAVPRESADTNYFLNALGVAALQIFDPDIKYGLFDTECPIDEFIILSNEPLESYESLIDYPLITARLISNRLEPNSPMLDPHYIPFSGLHLPTLTDNSSYSIFVPNPYFQFIEKESAIEHTYFTASVRRTNHQHRLLGYQLLHLPTLQDLYTDSLEDAFTMETKVLPQKDGGYLFALQLKAKHPEHLGVLPHHIYYLVDRSSSIDQQRFNAYKSAVSQSLTYLDKHTRFNILFLDGLTQALSSEETRANSFGISNAKRFVQKQQQNGSSSNFSNLYAQLSAIKQKAEKSGEPHTVILLSNGRFMKNIRIHQNVLSQLIKNPCDTFTIHTASAAEQNNDSMLELIADLNKGSFLHSSTHAALPRKLCLLVKRISQPVAYNLHITAADPQLVTLYHDPAVAPLLTTDKPYTIVGHAPSLLDLRFIIQARAGSRWIHIPTTTSLSSAAKAGSDLPAQIAHQKSLPLLLDFIFTNNPKSLHAAEKILKSDPLSR